MASHRIGARLAGLSQEQLIELIDKQAPLWSAAAMRVAEDHARLVEQPEWILSEVLLSPDLVPHILAQLPTKEHVAKGACRAWRRGWKETLAKRERPRLLVIGGYDISGVLVNSLERYDPTTNAWEEEAVALPTLTESKYTCTALLDGKIYVAGGVGADVLSSVERYHPATKSWEAVAPMMTARSALTMAVLNGKLYAVGGYCGGWLSSVERYDPALDAWEAVAPMATARDSLGLAVLDGKLYAVGGYHHDGGLHGSPQLSSAERYDPALDAWEAVAPMAEARAAHAAAVLEGKLYAVGGDGDGGHLSSVERYDPTANAWEAVAPMATGRSELVVGALYGKLYAVGGTKYDEEAGGETAANMVERFNPATLAWEELAPMATARLSPGVALL